MAWLWPQGVEGCTAGRCGAVLDQAAPTWNCSGMKKKLMEAAGICAAWVGRMRMMSALGNVATQ